MKNKKVLVLCQYFYPEKISSGVLPYELSGKLAEKCGKVTALVGHPKEYADGKNHVAKKEHKDGILIRRIRYIQANRRGAIGRLINMVSFALSVLFRPLQFAKHDYYICFTNPPILPFVTSIFAKIFGKKQITVIYDLYPDSPVKLGYLNEGSMICKVFDRLNRFVFDTSYKVVAISGDMKKYLVEEKGVKAEKIEVIHNWYKDSYEDITYETGKPVRILYGGNMGVAQDMKTITDAVELLGNDERFEFVFVGHGSKKEEIQKLIEKENIRNCKMYDFLPKDAYDELLKTSHMAVLSLEESVCGIGSPSKYYGYLALKKPVIAIVPEETDIAEDIREYQMGIHVKNGDAKKLRDELVRMYENPELLMQMSEQSYDMFRKKYTLEIASQKYISLL